MSDCPGSDDGWKISITRERGRKINKRRNTCSRKGKQEFTIPLKFIGKYVHVHSFTSCAKIQRPHISIILYIEETFQFAILLLFCRPPCTANVAGNDGPNLF